jgi:hypothetical protein
MSSGLPDKALALVTSVFVIASSSLFIDVYRNCDAAKNKKAYKDFMDKGFGPIFLAVAITIGFLCTFVMRAKSSVHLSSAMLSLVGVVMGGMTLGITKECKDSTGKMKIGKPEDRKNFAIASLVAAGVGIFLHGGMWMANR